MNSLESLSPKNPSKVGKKELVVHNIEFKGQKEKKMIGIILDFFHLSGEVNPIEFANAIKTLA